MCLLLLLFFIFKSGIIFKVTCLQLGRYLHCVLHNIESNKREKQRKNALVNGYIILLHNDINLI